MRYLGALALVVLPLAACGSEGGPEPVGGGKAIALPAHEESWDSAPDALVLGNLEFEEETGCVVLVSDEWRYPVVWPRGTSAQRDPFQLVLSDGTVVHEGAYVEGGGGYPSEVDADHANRVGIPPVCLEGPKRTRWSEIAVFNPDAEIAVDNSGERIVHPASQAIVPFAPTGSSLNGLTDSIEGTVEFRIETGCALLAADEKLYALVWPRGARGELDPFRVTLADGTVVREGDTIRGTGGVFPPDDLRALDPFAECSWDPETGETLEEAWTFNHDGVVEVVER